MKNKTTDKKVGPMNKKKRNDSFVINKMRTVAKFIKLSIAILLIIYSMIPLYIVLFVCFCCGCRGLFMWVYVYYSFIQHGSGLNLNFEFWWILFFVFNSAFLLVVVGHLFFFSAIKFQFTVFVFSWFLHFFIHLRFRSDVYTREFVFVGVFHSLSIGCFGGGCCCCCGCCYWCSCCFL